MAQRYLDLDGAPARQHRHDHSVGNETTLDYPIKELGQMEEVLWELVEEVGARLRRDELYARCLTVKIRYSNFQTLTRSRTLLSPTCFDKEIFETVSALLRHNIARGRTVRLLGVSASALQSPAGKSHFSILERRKSLERLYKGIDDLRRKYGERSIGVRHRHVVAPVDFTTKPPYCLKTSHRLIAKTTHPFPSCLPARRTPLILLFG